MSRAKLLAVLFLALTVISGPALAQVATPTTPPLISPGPNDQINPDANISWPPPVYVVRGTVEVRGSANLPNMTNYFIEFRALGADMAEPPDTQPWFPVSLPTNNSISNDVLASWDTTTADDGVYELRLTVNLASGEPIQSTVRPVRVENNPPPFVVVPTAVPPTVAAPPTAAPTIPPPATIAPPPTIAPTLDNTPRATVNVVNGNVRSGDSTLYNVILTVSNGTVLPIVGVSSNGTNWLLVDLPNGGRGWIAPSIVQISGNTGSLPRISPPPPPFTPTFTPIPATAVPPTPATAANLVAGLIRLSVNPPQCKQTFTVNVDIANLGTQDTTNSGTFLIQDISDGNEIARAFGPIGPIQAGKTVRSPDIPITVSSKHNDTHTLKITLNVENTIPETNTGDNVSQVQYKLGGDC